MNFDQLITIAKLRTPCRKRRISFHSVRKNNSINYLRGSARHICWSEPRARAPPHNEKRWAKLASVSMKRGEAGRVSQSVRRQQWLRKRAAAAAVDGESENSERARSTLGLINQLTALCSATQCNPIKSDTRRGH